MSIQEADKMKARFPSGWDSRKVSRFLEEKKPQVVILKTLWYPDVMAGLLDSALNYWIESGLDPKNLHVIDVPGSFELPLAAQMAYQGQLDAVKQNADIVVALGCVIKGDTPHFDFVCSTCSQALSQVQLQTQKPMGFGVLTVKTLEQALARRNKGFEASQAALYMALIEKAR